MSSEHHIRPWRRYPQGRTSCCATGLSGQIEDPGGHPREAPWAPQLHQGKSGRFDERMDSMNRDQCTRLEQIPNIGPSMANDLRLVGISRPRDLIGRDPYAMYEELCRKTEKRQDPCVLDVFISAVRFMQGEPERPWWAYTQERKRTLASVQGPRMHPKTPRRR